MTKKEYFEELHRLDNELKEFIENAAIYSDDKSGLGIRRIDFRNYASSAWHYAHPNED